MHLVTLIGMVFSLTVFFSAVLVGCDAAYPEVVVVNRIDEHTLIRNASFNGCVWESGLAYGEATPPGRCLPGKDRVHFQKLDGRNYCLEQAADRTIDNVCLCDGGDADDEVDTALIDEEPRWFNYQTLSSRNVDYGDFRVIEITREDMEQDFSVPGPYGH